MAAVAQEILIEYIKENKFDSSWISKIYSGKLYDVKKEKINDFGLKISLNDKYKEVVSKYNDIRMLRWTSN